MVITEPSDDKITRLIRKRDPTREHVDEWPEWRDQMLEGRGCVKGLFSRHRAMPSWRNKRSIAHLALNFLNWTPIIFASTSKKSKGKVLSYSSGSDLIVLEPQSEKYEKQESVHFLGIKFALGKLRNWGNNFPCQGTLKMLDGYVNRARYIFKIEHKLLKRVGIYGAIYISIFHYECSNNLFKSFVENRNHHINTCFMEDREISSTLLDLKYMHSLPIYREFYNEFVPNE